MRLETKIYHSKFNIIFILYKYNMNTNQVEISQIVLMKLSSEGWLVKLKFAKWFTVNKICFLIGKGLNMIDKHYLKMISKWSSYKATKSYEWIIKF